MKDTTPASPQNLRSRAEAIFSSRQTSPARVSDESRELLLQDLQVHQIELEMQNEELRMAQRDLEAALGAYFELYDLAPVGYLTLTKEGCILKANLVATTALGLPRTKLVMRPFSRFVHQDDQKSCHLFHQQSVQSTAPQNFELRLIRSDGEAFWANISTASPLTDTYLLSFVDITAAKLFEQKLEKAAEEWRTTFDTVPDPIAIIAPDYSILRSNRAFAEFVGKNSAELIGMKSFDLVHGQIGPAVECPLSCTLQEQTENSAEIYHAGHRKHLKVITTPLFSTDGTFVGAVHVMHDITLSKEFENLQKETQAELEAKVSERTSDLFLANERTKKMTFELVWAEEQERERIAGELHDRVGQSLLLAKMKLDTLALRLPPGEQRSGAEETSQLLHTSINEIRSLTFRMRPPILETSGLDCALEWLCSSICTDYGLQIDFYHEHRPLPLSAEVRYALYQAVRELLINVVKYAGTGEVRLSLTTVDNCLMLQVTDNGIGFDYAEMCRTRDKKNSYGLRNVLHRMEHIGGRCDVESAPGKGTRVTLTVLLAEIEWGLR